jgi:hypothetical protein
VSEKSLLQILNPGYIDFANCHLVTRTSYWFRQSYLLRSLRDDRLTNTQDPSTLNAEVLAEFNLHRTRSKINLLLTQFSMVTARKYLLALNKLLGYYKASQDVLKLVGKAISFTKVAAEDHEGVEDEGESSDTD